MQPDGDTQAPCPLTPQETQQETGGCESGSLPVPVTQLLSPPTAYRCDNICPSTWVSVPFHVLLQQSSHLTCPFMNNLSSKSECVFCHFFLMYLFLVAAGLGGCMRAFSGCGETGATPCGRVQASHCGRFSCCGARALGTQVQNPGAQASLLCGTWTLPRPGIKPVSLVLASGFLSTVPPGKSLFCYLLES